MEPERLRVAALCALLLCGIVFSAEQDVASLGWMAGTWVKETERARQEEYWIAPLGGLMLGLHRDVSKDGKVFFENLRIEARDSGLVYVASPRGTGTTEFPLVEIGERRVAFANPEHDWPTRITYSREGDTLCARAEGEQNGKHRAADWCWTLVSGGPIAP